MTSVDWDDYRIFIALAEAGSLTQAGKDLGVTHTTVLRRINALEERLSVRLFKRHTSGYTLTAPGERMLETVLHLKDDIYQAERMIMGEDVRLSGTIKISTTDTIAGYWLPPYIKAFKARYPDIVIDLNITTRHINLSKREADIVIPAINRQPDYMIGRVLEPIRFNIYGHKDYIKSHNIGAAVTPQDFKKYDFLLPNEALAEIPPNIYVRKHIEEGNIAATADKISALYYLCCQSLGLAPLPSYLGESQPDLVALMTLPEAVQKNAIWILTHPDLRHTARIKAFMEFMREASSGGPA